MPEQPPTQAEVEEAVTLAWDRAIRLRGAESALMLDAIEWRDLAFIVGVWRRATEDQLGNTEQEITVTLRRRSLADRIIEAA